MDQSEVALECASAMRRAAVMQRIGGEIADGVVTISLLTEPEPERHATLAQSCS
jgi:hypothetical protein